MGRRKDTHDSSAHAQKKRAYESELRRAQAEETTEKILAAAAELARELPSWDWQTLTMTAVADRAGVGRRTLYRHFESQATLHGALLAYMHRGSGVRYDDLSLDDLPAMASRVFSTLSSFKAAPWAVLPAPFPEVDEERRAGLLRAAREACAGAASGVDPDRVAAALDVIWQVTSFEILLRDWKLAPDEARDVLRWLHDRVVQALETGD